MKTTAKPAPRDEVRGVMARNRIAAAKRAGRALMVQPNVFGVLYVNGFSAVVQLVAAEAEIELAEPGKPARVIELGGGWRLVVRCGQPMPSFCELMKDFGDPAIDPEQWAAIAQNAFDCSGLGVPVPFKSPEAIGGGA